MAGNTDISELVALDVYVKKFNSMFKCQMCGKCCRVFTGTRVNSSDINLLAKGLRITPKAIVEQYMRMLDGHLVLKQPCPFWTPDAGCAVYGIRPTVCQQFPLQNVRCTDGLPHIGVTHECTAGLETLAVLEAEISSYIPKEIFLANKS